MSFAVVLPADDSQRAELREMSPERSVYEQICEASGDPVEIVQPVGLHDLAPLP